MKKHLLSVLLLLMMAIGAVAQDHIVANGTGTNSNVPVYGLYCDAYLRSQVIYPEDMLSGAGITAGSVIEGLEYYSSSQSVSWGNTRFAVMIGECADETFSSTAYADNSSFTTVYSGMLSIVNYKMTVEFSTPYTYNGGNMIIEVQDIEPDDYSGASFYGVTLSGSSLQGYSYESLESVACNQKEFIPKTNFLLQPSCPKPKMLSATNVSVNSATISWTAAESQNYFVVAYGTGTDPDAMQTINATTNSVELVGLTPSTIYNVFVKAVCSVSDESEWNTIQFATLAVPFVVDASNPFVENFEDSPSFDFINGSIANKWVIGSAVSNGGSNALYVSNDNGVSNAYDNETSTMIYAAKLLSMAAGVYHISYDWIANGEENWDYMRVALVPASVTISAGTALPSGLFYNTVPEGWIAVDGGTQLSLQSAWQSLAEDFNVEVAGNYNLVFAWRNDGSSGNNPPAAIDNIRLSMPSCPTPFNVLVSGISSNAATINWTAGAEDQNSFAVAYGTSNNPEECATVNATSTTATLSGLAPNTTYNVWVKTVCSESDQSEWTAKATFRTNFACGDEYTYKYGVIGDGTSTSYTYFAYAYGTTSTSYANGISGHLFMAEEFANFELYDNNMLNGIKVHSASNGSMDLTIFVSNTDKSNFTTSSSDVLATAEMTQVFNGVVDFVAGDWTPIIFDTPFAYDNSKNLAIVIRRNANTSNNISMYYSSTGSNYYTYYGYKSASSSSFSRNRVASRPNMGFVFCSETPSCVPVTNVVANNITSSSASILWTKLDEAQNNFVVAYGTGSDLEECATVEATTNSVVLTNLNPNTTYNVWVKAVCSAEDNSEWSRMTTFNTPCEYIATLPFVEDFEAYEGATYNNNGVAPDCWEVAATNSNNIKPHVIGGGSYSYVHSGSKALTFYGSGDCYAALPMFAADLNTLAVEFYSAMENASKGTLTLGYITAADVDFNTFAPIEVYENSNQVMVFHSTSLANVPATAYRLVFKWTYTNQYSCCIDDLVVRALSSDAEILAYSIATETAPAVINSEDATITVTVTNSTDIDNLVPTITISEYAEISEPVIAGEGDSRTYTYTVTAESGLEKEWVATITKAPVSHDAFITAFTFAGQKAETTATIVSDVENDTFTVNAVAEWNTVLTAITPNVTVSPSATYTPSDAQDFTNGVEYEVTAEDGTTSHTYMVTIVNDPDACVNPATVAASEITATGAKLSWAQAYRETSYRVKVSTTAMTDMTATADAYDNVVEDVELVLAELTPNTHYYVYVQSDCDNAEGWTSANFTTLCAAITDLPWSEDFEDYSSGNFTADCWKNVHVSGTRTDIFKVYTGTNGTNSTHQLQLPDMQDGNVTLLTLPQMNFVAANACVFSISVYRNSTTNKPTEGIRILATPDGTEANATEMAFIPRIYTVSNEVIPAESTTGWYTYTLTIPIAEGNILVRGESRYGTATYMDNFVVRTLGTEAEILTYSIATETAPAVINSEEGTIAVTVTNSSDIDNLVPTITISEYAEISEPIIAGEGDSRTYTYTVTAENGTTKTWVATITKAPISHDAFITAFSFAGQKAETTATIVSDVENDTFTVNAVAEWNTDITAITPNVTVSPAATYTPAGAQDFTNGIEYEVTAEDGTTSHTYVVNIVNDPYACINPTGLTVTDITGETATISWTASYTETGYNVKVSSTAMTDMTATADIYDNEVAATTLALENLLGLRTYYVYVQSNCGIESWVSTSFRTSCPVGAVVLPYVEDFAEPQCWNIYDANNDGKTWTFVSGEAKYTYNRDDAANDWLVSPKLAIVENAKMKFDYKVGNSIYPEMFSVYVITGTPDNYAEATLIVPTITYQSTIYRTLSPVDLSDYAGQDVYIGIKCESSANQFTLLVDNFAVEVAYTITATAGENGTITPAGNVVVNEGANQAFTIAANEGYRLASVLVDNVEAIEDVEEGVYTFENVTANHTIAATFEAVFTIVASADENGTITPNGNVVVESGADQSFTISANEGYRLAAVLVDDVDTTAYVENGVFTFTNVTANHTIAATFELIPTYTITATAGEHGTISPDGEVEIREGLSLVYVITADEGYQIASVLVDDVDTTAYVEDGIFTFTNVTANHTIVATFEAIPAVTYTITATAGEHGTITPEGDSVVVEGATVAYAIAANEGYRIASVLVDDAEAIEDLVDGVYTFTNVVANHTIAATFEAIPVVTYTITATAGEHGTIEPAGETVVNAGETVAYTITPDDNYQIDVVTVDGADATADVVEGVYTFANIDANHTISVTFVPVTSVEIMEAGSIATYPNPNNGMFNIDFSNIEGEATYQLVDVKGAMIDSREINVMNGETMNFNYDLRPGTYFVRIITSDSVYVEQIVVR